jgi:hypothetical protein
MAFEDEAPLERSYPYRMSWRSLGCLIASLASVGVVGIQLLLVGCERIQQGNLPVGIFLGGLGACGIPLMLLAGVMFVGGIRDTLRPPLLRVSTTELILPDCLQHDTHGETTEPPDRPAAAVPSLAHPERIPFAAIRQVSRGTALDPGDEQLIIEHELCPHPLVIQQNMMNPSDFDELETVLRVAVPQAFRPSTEEPTETPLGSETRKDDATC